MVREVIYFDNGVSCPNILVLWRKELARPVALASSKQHITILLEKVMISCIHADCSYVRQRELWRELSIIGTSNLLWLVVGNFNVVLRSVEKKGGRGLKLENDIANDNLVGEVTAANNLLKKTYSNDEELCWQKARVDWLQSGDRNTAYFHAMMYQEASGQVFNSEKNKLFLGAMNNEKKQQVKDIFRFDVACLPETFLGIPLIQGRVTKEILRPLVDKIKKRATRWAGSLLSIQGRVVLTKSVLSSISIYSMGIYKWPTSVIKEGERILRNFLWFGEPDTKKACVVAWDKDEWSEFMRAKFIAKSSSFSTCTKDFSIWAGVRGALEDVCYNSGWVIGDGSYIDLWREIWCSSISLKDLISNDNIPWKNLHAKVSSIIVDGRWSLPYNLLLLFYGLGMDINSIKINTNKADRRVWKPDLVGKFYVKGVFNVIQPKGQTIWWSKYLHRKAIHPQTALWGWRFCHGKLPTDDNLQKKGISIISRCRLCSKGAETLTHLFWNCPFSSSLWSWLETLFNVCIVERNLKSLILASDTMSPYLKDLWIGAIWGGRMYNNQSDLGILRSLGVPLHPSKSTVIKSCSWELPRKGEIKINTDGAARGNLGKGGIGCIFKDCKGNVFGTLAKGLRLNVRLLSTELHLLLLMVGLLLGWNSIPRRQWKPSTWIISHGT
ncbi:hypothetical protein GIB67_039012 [Kingdonia uniflora]|uniref:Reverse transcriptase zinc-binding domain-containing protein n=1 Tax=Kingdonia uniflora TaxID=39325 RepID=A0A7J7LKY1_9MAGN|nr:hypothetical protein GIB67_039012 [Kingdonia uniflora]